MSRASYETIRREIIDCLSQAFQLNSAHVGWGRCQGSAVSIVNTTEALLTLDNLESFNIGLIQDNREAIVGFIKTAVTKEIESEDATVRFLSYGALSLHLLGCDDIEEECVVKLNSLAFGRGGWAERGGGPEPLLLSTFHALSCLQRMGREIPEVHLNWIQSLQKADDLLPYSKSEMKSDFGASCLALYLLSQSKFSQQPSTTKLSQAISQRLPTVFSSMSRGNEEWVSNDPKTGFKTYGYGHALMGQHHLGQDLLQQGALQFLSAVAAALESGSTPRISTALSFDPRTTWVPALLEQSLAFKAIRLSFDPYAFLEHAREEEKIHETEEAEAEKGRIRRESATLEIRQRVIDEWEKEVIRERAMLTDLESLKKELSEAAIAGADASLRKHVLYVQKEIGNFLIILIFALALAGYVVFRVSNEGMSLKALDAVIALVLVGLGLFEIYGRRKRLKNYLRAGS